MLNPVMAAPFEDIEKTENIAVDICMGIDQGVSDPSLCGKINHPFKTTCAEKLLRGVAVGKCRT